MFSPFNKYENDEFGKMLNDVFSHFVNDDFFSSPKGFKTGVTSDMIETDNHYIIIAELPGFKKEEIKVEYKNEHLIIRVTRKLDVETKDSKQNYIHQERSFGDFSRSYYVGNVNREEIKAKFENGLLELTIPKKTNEEKNQYRIDID